MKSIKILFFLLIVAFLRNTNAQGGTEIYLLDLKKSKTGFVAANPENITNRKGYDNQPCFSEDGNKIYFVSFRDTLQSDIYQYDLKIKVTSQVTKNNESEYSPRITPDGKHISVVKGTAQNLSMFDWDGTDPQILVKHKDSIGYYNWLNKEEIAAFILTSPPTLQLMNIKTGINNTLMRNPGRSIFKYKDGIIVTNKENTDTCVITYVTRQGDRLDWMELPPGTEDFFLSENGHLFTSHNGKILYSPLRTEEADWKDVIDLSGLGIKKITRIVVDKKESRMVVVAAE